MTDIATTLKFCHELVWKYRAELEPFWPTPKSARDSARFAVCEACESMDAMLRLNTDYARNNAKELSVEAELADCLMMMLTAIGKVPTAYGDAWNDFDFLTWDDRWKDNEQSLDIIVIGAATVLKFCGVLGYDRTWRASAWNVCSDIALYVGPTVTEQLRSRLERIRLKRMPKPKVTVEDAYVAMSRKVADDTEVLLGWAGGL
jgi:hypothetical protein